MSDTPPSSTKPKVGSLRDRIAAFEKPAAGNSQPGPAPVPRPKPGGVSWKPKVPSPPSSPGGVEHVVSEKKAGGMSASDAKESIGKGGSLKDRMAALQGKGAFGAPPPVAPKPSVEKPKWKPPPVVAPVDKDEDQPPPVESSTSPPLPSPTVRSSEDDRVIDTHEEETAPGADGEDQTEVDSKEDERQRRAAIAARMARLGGARVGMAPMFGRPPVAKKPEPVQDANPTPFVDDDSVAPAPAEEQTVGTSDVSAPARGSSESLLQPSGDNEPQASRSPNSMPLPSAPRRAAPPRKKGIKSPMPPTAVIEVPLTETPDILSTADTPAITKKTEASDSEQKIGEVTSDPVAPSSDPEAPALIPEEETAINDDQDEKLAHVTPPSHAPDVPDDAEDDDNEVAYRASIEHEPSPARLDEDVKESIEHPAEEPEGEEAARRKRVAERLAKMGGINPLALPAQRKSSIDETPTSAPISPALAKRASLSRQGTDTLSPVQRRQSMRKSSVDSTAVSEGSTVQRKLSIDETQTPPPVSPSLSKRASLSRQTTDPVQRRQSLRKSSVDSTTVLEANTQDFPSRPSPISPQSRKSSVDPTVSGNVSESVSRRASLDVGGHVGQGVAITHIPEESGPSTDIAGVRGKREAHSEEPKSKAKGINTRHKLDAADESLEVVDPDDEPGTSAPLVIPTPPTPKWTTRPQAVPVDPARAVEPIPIPPRTLEQFPPAALPPSRSIPPPPPFLMPQQHGDDDATGSYHEDVEETSASYRISQTSEDEGSPRRIPPMLGSNDDGTDNESAPLPVPTRRPPQPRGGRSPTTSLTSSSRPVRRSIPPPPPPVSAPSSDVEQDSDLDEILPTPPRHRPTTPGVPPSNEVPLIVPPPHSEDSLRKIVEPSPLRHSYPSPIHTSSDSTSSTPEHESPSYFTSTLSVSDQEILDEEEGDPIDPAFHSPHSSLAATPPAQHTQVAEQAAVEQRSEQLADAEQVKRTTIAERMAKLGGIKFGAAPIPPSIGRPPPPPRIDDESSVHDADAPAPEEQGEIEEEEEERARKERIAAKLAGMGGMRIGMMPLGPGVLRPQQSQAAREDNATPVPPAVHPRAVPPSRHPPPQSDSDLEHESMSTSHYSLSTSEEGVKVEAEESELEEVSHDDAKEEVAPPVPTRPARRSASEPESMKAVTVPPNRPPVPTSTVTRRSNIQVTTSGRKSSADSSSSPRRSATMRQHSDYVMVEEPKRFLSDEVPPPPPPGRPLSRAPSAREAPSRRPTDISSQWELPSIPSSSLEFGDSADLSLSWSDAGTPETTVAAPPPAPEKPSVRTSQIFSPDQPLSSDDLIAIWGRVGVQMCEAATSLFDKSKKSLVGDGTYHGFVSAVVSEVPNAALPAPPSYGYVVYVQSGSAVQKRVSEIMPGDVVELRDAKFKGHKGIHNYNQHVGVGEPLVGVVSEFEPKKSKIRLFQANQHVGQQTVEGVSYRLEDLKSGTVTAFRVMEA